MVNSQQLILKLSMKVHVLYLRNLAISTSHDPHQQIESAHLSWPLSADEDPEMRLKALGKASKWTIFSMSNSVSWQ